MFLGRIVNRNFLQNGVFPSEIFQNRAFRGGRVARYRLFLGRIVQRNFLQNGVVPSEVFQNRAFRGGRVSLRRTHRRALPVRVLAAAGA